MAEDVSPASWDETLELDEDAPDDIAPSSQAGRFYRVDSSHATCRELWRDVRNPAVVIVWMTKLLRVKLPGAVNDPNVVSLLPFEVADDSDFPPPVRETIAPVLRELTDLGFHSPHYFFLDDAFHQNQTRQLVLIARDGKSLARIVHRAEHFSKTKVHFFVEFISAFGDGTFLHSSSARAQLLAPAAVELNWQFKATTSQLWVSHRQALDRLTRSGKAVVTLSGRDLLLDAVERHHEAVRDFHLQRGLFSSMQGADLEQATAIDRNRDAARRGEMNFPEVMAQIQRMQTKQTNWSSGLLILIVSIGLFIGAGANMDWSWEFLLMIVGLLLFHEAGHFIAMKVFRYRNVKMFFIPFLGAAVSGQHYNAPGWKKIIVALMGPLPGILLGGVLGAIGAWKGNDLLFKTAMVAIILNAFNLIPVLPLDGGRVMHALLFCRHHYLDAVFRVLAGGALIGISLLAGDRILMYLGIFMLIAVPGAYKVAKIATELRRAGVGTPPPPPVAFAGYPGGPMFPPQGMPFPPMPAVPAPAPVFASSPPPAAPPVDEHEIPQPVAERIIERVQVAFPRIKSPKQIAEMTLRVYETLATRPPGIGASVAFGFVHVGAILISIFLAVAVVVMQAPGLRGLASLAANLEPAHALEASQIEVSLSSAGSHLPAPATGPGAVENEGAQLSRTTIIGTFESPSDADELYREVVARKPTYASAALLGQSVLLSLPANDEAARERWFQTFEQRTNDVFVDTEEAHASLRLTCKAPDEKSAEAIAAELNGYFTPGAQLYLIPPWTPPVEDKRSAADRQAHDLARKTYLKLQTAGYYDYEDPRLKAINEKVLEATRRGDRVRLKKLMEEQTKLTDSFRAEGIKAVRGGSDGPVDTQLVDRFIAIERDRDAALKPVETEAAPATGRAAGEAEDVVAEPAEYDYAAFLARERNELGPLMGQLPLQGDEPIAGAARYSHVWGNAAHAEQTITFYGVSFVDIVHGAPALIHWLSDKGCSDFKYDLTAGSAYGDEYFD